jgi:hypothetical protein
MEIHSLFVALLAYSRGKAAQGTALPVCPFLAPASTIRTCTFSQEQPATSSASRLNDLGRGGAMPGGVGLQIRLFEFWVM